jgi:hypothetical protein
LRGWWVPAVEGIHVKVALPGLLSYVAVNVVKVYAVAVHVARPLLDLYNKQ